VQALLFRYMTANTTNNNAEEHLSAAYTKLALYEHRERLVLVELAVYKALCLLDMVQHNSTTNNLDYYKVQQWCASGWKTRKHVHCKSSQAQIVVRSVLPSLEQPGTGVRTPFVPGTTARPWATTTTTTATTWNTTTTMAAIIAPPPDAFRQTRRRMSSRRNTTRRIQQYQEEDDDGVDNIRNFVQDMLAGLDDDDDS
jgi:hypothetical protein